MERIVTIFSSLLSKVKSLFNAIAVCGGMRISREIYSAKSHLPLN